MKKIKASLVYSNLECDSLTENDLEENPDVKSCFEPYQGEPLANCADQELVSVCEYRCCKEIVEASGKFTWIGKNAECIPNHPDFNAMTNETVLSKVGPHLSNKNDICYRIKNGANKKYVELYIYLS